ncbi:MAG: hydantoinase B/oxoprolinase family protein [Alphaproteobacteria bacterium]|nr:hydantoinase B/oxoprolinase family protein [Alphaproteobacteria bacterium]
MARNAPDSFDAVSLGILWDRLISLTDEIVSTLVRTSFSTIVSESYDLSCVVLDAEANSIAQGTMSIPVFIGSAPVTARHMLNRFPPETLKPGDVIFTNDPWLGTGHLFDVTMMRPVFRDGRIVAYTMSITHLPDIGGTGFGSAATEIYQEGLRFPIGKIADAGRIDERLIELVRANVRVPEQVVGDLMANVACNEVGGRQVLEFMDEYGIDDLGPLSRAIREQSEKAMREKIAGLKPGIYRNRIELEGLDQPIRFACRIEVKGDRIHVDFDGTGPCVRAGINVPFCYAHAMSLYSIKTLTLPSIPNNAGMTAPITVSAPVGCILNAQPPFATGGRHAMGHFVTPLIYGALAKAAPDRVQADSGMMNLVTFQGRHRNGRGVSTIYFAAGGYGALDGTDGVSTVPHPSNMAVVPVEVWETITSTTIERKNLLPDSGGAGKSRGGLGQEVVLRNDSGSPMTLLGMGNRTQFPARGLFGGGDGSLRVHALDGVPVNAKARIEMPPGARVTVREAGAGGFGDPRKRPVETVLSDVLDGFVTSKGALRDYGVKVDLRSGTAERVAAKPKAAAVHRGAKGKRA